MSDLHSLENYLHAHIPLTKAMQVSVVLADPGQVILAAPLQPNINHRETVFGGSASAVCILAAWSLIHIRLLDAAITARIVIQRNSMEYQRPILTRFQATCSAPDTQHWQRFLQGLHRKGAGRIHLQSTLTSQNQPCGHFQGAFVALMNSNDGSVGS